MRVPTIEPILHHVLPLMLVVARLTGLFVFTPMLSSGSVPRVYRALLAFMFALAIYPFVPAIDPGVAIDTIQLVPLLFAELLIGLAIGLIASIPLIAVQMGGYIMGYQMGLSLAESFNPELQANGSVIGDLLFYLAALMFIGMGGFDVLFVTLAHSFHTAPVGRFAAGDLPLDMLVGVLTSGFELALRISAPVLAVVSLLMVSMGFVMKTMPQINIMSVGFAGQIVAGLAILFVSVAVIGMVADDEVQAVLTRISLWVHALAPPAPAPGAGAADGVGGWPNG